MCIIIRHHGYIYILLHCTVVQRLESGCARLGHRAVLCVNLKKKCLRSLVYQMQVVSVTV